MDTHTHTRVGVRSPSTGFPLVGFPMLGSQIYVCVLSLREVGYVTGMLIYNGYRLVNPNPSRHEVSFIPGVIWSRRRNWCRAPRVRRRRSYRLLRARAGKKRRQGGKGEGGAEPDRTGQDTTRPDSDRGARRPRPELQSRLVVVMSGLA